MAWLWWGLLFSWMVSRNNDSLAYRYLSMISIKMWQPTGCQRGGEINWRERNIYGTQSTSSWSQEHAWFGKIIFFFVLECLITKKLSRMSGILSFVLQDFWNARKSSFGGRRDPPDTPIFIVFALFISLALENLDSSHAPKISKKQRRRRKKNDKKLRE